ncbi:uncharacterized protein LOC62_04G006592 [Vanrija pseudolonga]|uniref:Uncharacterized protein n=1 Tax=Vanrija pseudolonga TaxID=143232 RepID=A0AAF1BJ78_9TREE|nr:hypothetical protein LOC62_04G006592 [Vanrija pseudolonga]
MGNDLHFEPENDFPEGGGQLLIVQAADGTVFRFSLDRLAQFSPKLQAFKVATAPGGPGAAPLDFSFACADGLRLAFGMLNDHFVTPKPTDKFPWPNTKVVESIVNLMEVHQLYKLGELLIERTNFDAAWRPANKLEWFAVASMIGGDTSAPLDATCKYSLNKANYPNTLLDGRAEWLAHKMDKDHPKWLADFKEHHEFFQWCLAEFEKHLKFDFADSHHPALCDEESCDNCDPEADREVNFEARRLGLVSQVRLFIDNYEEPWKKELIEAWGLRSYLSRPLAKKLTLHLRRLTVIMRPNAEPYCNHLHTYQIRPGQPWQAL